MFSSLNLRPSGGPGLADIWFDEFKLLQQPGDSMSHNFSVAPAPDRVIFSSLLSRTGSSTTYTISTDHQDSTASSVPSPTRHAPSFGDS